MTRPARAPAPLRDRAGAEAVREHREHVVFARRERLDRVVAVGARGERRIEDAEAGDDRVERDRDVVERRIVRERAA